MERDMPASSQSDLEEGDGLEASVDQAIAACGGDVRATVQALIVANGLLEAELREVYAATSKGFARGRVKRSQQN